MPYKFLACFLCSFLAFNFHSLSAKELEREAKVILIKGDVQIQKAGKTGWTAAKEGMLLSNGDTAKTGKASAIELSFDKDNKNMVRLEENSTAILRGKMLKQIELPQGRIRSLVKNLKKESSFEIKTPTVVAGARGSGWDVTSSEKGDNVKALEDEIFVQSYDQQGSLIKEIYVREGWEVNIERFQAPGELVELTERDRNDWSSWREDLGERLQPAGTTEDKNRSQEFRNVETIENITEKQNDFKEQILETEDTTRIENRIEAENAEERQEHNTGPCSGGDNGIYCPEP